VAAKYSLWVQFVPPETQNHPWEEEWTQGKRKNDHNRLHRHRHEANEEEVEVEVEVEMEMEVVETHPAHPAIEEFNKPLLLEQNHPVAFVKNTNSNILPEDDGP
jgi:hypothetical protein